jgi:hypothetical protein
MSNICIVSRMGRFIPHMPEAMVNITQERQEFIDILASRIADQAREGIREHMSKIFYRPLEERERWLSEIADGDWHEVAGGIGKTYLRLVAGGAPEYHSPGARGERKNYETWEVKRVSGKGRETIETVSHEDLVKGKVAYTANLGYLGNKIERSCYNQVIALLEKKLEEIEQEMREIEQE